MPSSSRVQVTFWKKVQKDHKNQRLGRTRQNRTTAHTNIEQLYEIDQCEIKPVSILAQSGEGLVVFIPRGEAMDR